MEQYYFIEKNGTKLGPYKLNELKQQTIYFDELIWRSDSDQWKKASDYEELSGIYIIKPPPTPKEKKVEEVNEKSTNQIIGWLIAIYVMSSLLIGIISFSIAQSSWENYNLKHPIQSSGRNYNNLNGGSIPRSLAEMSSDRYDSFVPGNYNNEDAYGLGQSFWFRPFKAFGGTVYLTLKEQNDSNSLLQ